MGMASAAVNGPLKFAWQRDRPAAEVLGLSESLLPLPRTYSFPSGHSASAFAFATGVSLTLPPAAPAVLPLAGAVAYSRVHTGVHFPSDVLAGAAIGSAAGLGAAAIVRRVQSPSRHRPQTPVLDVPVPRDVVLVTSKKARTAGDLNGAKATLDAVGFRITDEVDVRDAARLSDLLAAAGDDTPLVVAAGGDGTVGAAAGAVLGTSALLGILPLGTANDVARSLGIPPDARDAAEALASGVVCAVDAGRVRRPGEPDRTFVRAATAGLNVQFAKFASASALRDRFGALTYPVSAALALRRYPPFECTIERDDGESDTFPVVHVSVSNATVFGGPLGMRVPGADITDGKLDVIAVGPLTAVGLSLATAKTVVGRHSPVRRVRTYQARSLRIAAQGRQHLAADGEVVGELPAQFRVLPGALRVVVPAVA
jgi:undecaprenyl-diphosphatase